MIQLQGKEMRNAVQTECSWPRKLAVSSCCRRWSPLEGLAGRQKPLAGAELAALAVDPGEDQAGGAGGVQAVPSPTATALGRRGQRA